MERTALLGRLSWQLGEVVATQQETVRTKSITLALPTWRGHQAGQHMDVRLTAQDGYQAERSYSIASPPEEEHRLTLTVERLDDGELRVGDQLELRGPIGGYFVWEAQMGGPLLLVAGGSGIVPLMAMLREVAWPSDQYPQMYICGPTPFVETAAASLVTLGHEPGRVKTERFGPTGEA